MTVYVFRTTLLPNPPLQFTPDQEVWRDIAVDETHTLADFHEAIFEAFDRWDSHAYEFRTRDADGIATRSYVHPQLYDGEPSWPPMDSDEIERFIDEVVPDDVSDDAKERFRELQSDPPEERNAAETEIADVDPEDLHSMYYEFDFGDGWEHHVELRETRDGSLAGGPEVVDEQGEAPPQYPEYDE